MTTPASTVAEHLERLECTPLVAVAARQIAEITRWIPTDRQDLGYVGLKCTAGGQIAVYINRNFFGFALDRPVALAFHEQLGGRVKDKEPTVYVELFEADLELLSPTDRVERLVELAQAALTRNRDRNGTDGNKATGPARTHGKCPTCNLSVNALGECDDHGSLR